MLPHERVFAVRSLLQVMVEPLAAALAFRTTKSSASLGSRSDSGARSNFVDLGSRGEGDLAIDREVARQILTCIDRDLSTLSAM